MLDHVADLLHFAALHRTEALSFLRENARRYSVIANIKFVYERFPDCRLSAPEIATALRKSERHVKGMRSLLVREGQLICVDFETLGRTALPPRYRFVNKDHRGVIPLTSPSSPLNPAPQDLNREIEFEGQIRDRTRRSRGTARARCRPTRAPEARAPSRSTSGSDRRKPGRRYPPSPPRRGEHVAVEEGVWRALSLRFDGHAATTLRRELCFERYHQYPEETGRALRTLLVRAIPAGVVLLQYFRGLFKLALRGEALCDRDEWRAADREAVLAEVMRGAPAPSDPVAAWQQFHDDLASRLSAVRLADAGSEHAGILETALVLALNGLQQAKRDAAARKDAEITRDIASQPFATPEALYEALDRRVAVELRAEELAEQVRAQLAALSDETLEAYVRSAAATLQSAVRAGRWHAEEHARALLQKYLAELDRRRKRARVTPAPDREH